MLRDRHDRLRMFASVPARGLAMDSVLAQVDRLLEDNILVQRVQPGLIRWAAHTATGGGPSTPAELILRMLEVRRSYEGNDEETEQYVAYSPALHQCCRAHSEPVPDGAMLLR